MDSLKTRGFVSNAHDVDIVDLTQDDDENLAQDPDQFRIQQDISIR